MFILLINTKKFQENKNFLHILFKVTQKKKKLVAFFNECRKKLSFMEHFKIVIE